MSRCKACNEILSDKEMQRKYLDIDEEIGLCDLCLSDTEIPYIESNNYGNTPEE